MNNNNNNDNNNNNNKENDDKKKKKIFSHSIWNHQISRNFATDMCKQVLLASLLPILRT